MPLALSNQRSQSGPNVCPVYSGGICIGVKVIERGCLPRRTPCLKVPEPANEKPQSELSLIQLHIASPNPNLTQTAEFGFWADRWGKVESHNTGAWKAPR
jgi:hypothetical protein